MAPSIRHHQDALLRILEGQLEVLARRQALGVGLTKHALDHRLRPSGPWRSLLPGVYLAATGTPTTLQEEMAALLYAGDDSVITGSAALRCHHMGKAIPDRIDVLVPADRKRRDAGFVRLHRTTRMPERIWQVGPVRYTLLPRAVADAARDMASLRDVRALVADAVQRGRCPVPELAAELAEGQKSGSARFRVALADVADGIRSTAEADLKDLMVKARLPMPLFNPSLYAADGTFIARPDGWWPELGIAIEVDSLEWHLSPQDHADTLARGRRMARYQIIVLRFTPRQLRTDPATVIRDIKEALKGARGRPPLAKLQTVPAESDKPDASNADAIKPDAIKPDASNTDASNADASEDTGQPFREPAVVA